MRWREGGIASTRFCMRTMTREPTARILHRSARYFVLCSACIRPSTFRPAYQGVLILLRKLVLPDRIELSTSPLPMECSTTELRQHAPETRIGPEGLHKAGRSLPQGPLLRKRGTVT